MGRQTYESIGKPLPNRINIIITRDPYYLSTGCLIAHSVDEALSIAADHGESEAFIIGGSQVYRSSMEDWDRIYLTRLDLIAENPDAYFPRIDLNEWTLISSESHEPDEKNKWCYVFEVYDRKSSY
jgi:dihydrofolate reductase